MAFTISKPFLVNGIFFIPNDENGYNGNLKYTPNEGLFLQLKDLPLNYEETLSTPIITGRIYGDPYSCTLVNIRYEHRNFSGNQDGLSSISTFFIGAVFLGEQISDPNELIFAQVGFSYSNFREWVNKPSIITDYTKDDNPTVFKNLPSITGNLDDIFDFEIGFYNSGSFMKETFDISIQQEIIFNIKSKNKTRLPISQYMELNKIIKYFLMFMYGSYVVEESISCTTTSKVSNVELVQFYQRFAEPKKLTNRDFRHTYDSISMKFERILKNWIEKYRKMPDFFNSFFENVINENLFTYDKFENLIQSLLFYYNNKFEKDTRMPKEEYRIFFEGMKNKLNDQEKEFVERFRGMGNNLSLSNQLEKIFLQLDFWKENPSQYKKYIDQIVLVRNRISHATKNITPDTLRDASNMTHNLTSFISTLILYEIEYDQ